MNGFSDGVFVLLFVFAGGKTVCRDPWAVTKVTGGYEPGQ